jgi:RNA polymerase sigma factor (sigma-70 family)
MTDRELIDASRRGERAAFGQLVERYQALVCAVSYTATGDQALSEDVAQETFLAAWRQLGPLHSPAKLRPWLCGIARNLGRRARRDLRREVLDEAADAPVADRSPYDAAELAEAQRLVRDTLSRIPETYREVLVLYYPLAAEDQGKFWQLHDLMMANQHDLSRDALVGYAARAGLDSNQLAAALDRRSYREKVKADQAAGQEIEIRGTPAFLINGVRYTGARPIEQFRAAIDSALAERR